MREKRGVRKEGWEERREEREERREEKRERRIVCKKGRGKRGRGRERGHQEHKRTLSSKFVQLK